MGGAVSSGRDNDELIDNLMGANYIRTRSVELVFRALDRAEYMTRDARDQAYKDLAWRNGSLHMSAPCIYSEVMENLELHPGLSFLNVGSGTGYLSTLVGLMLGSQGINHGVEVRRAVLDYSNRRLSQFMENSPTLDEFDFCEPKFQLGNGLCLAPLATPYDRVYCGAACPPEYENYFKQLIKVGGILVMPLDDNLVQVKRLGENEWSSRTVLNVSFATLIVPTKEQAAADLVKLDEQTPVRLQVMARAVVRAAMRAGLRRRHPELRAAPSRAPPAKKACPRRICIPIDDDDDVEGLGALHDLYRDNGAHEMNALLSFMLSMGHNRVAGALRFDPTDTSSDSEPDSDVEEDHGGGDISENYDSSPSHENSMDNTDREERRGRCPLITLDLRDMLAAPAEHAEGAEHAGRADGPADDVRMDSPDAEHQPDNSDQLKSPEEPTTRSVASDEDKTSDKLLDRGDSGEGSSRSSGDSSNKQQDKSSEESSKVKQDRKGSGENSKDRPDRRSSGECSRPQNRRSSGEHSRGSGDNGKKDDGSEGDNPEVPAEVEILLGKTSSSEPSTSKWSMEWEEGAVLENSSDDEGEPRQKLDSGIGEENSPDSTSPSKSDKTEESDDGSRRSDSLTDDVDDARVGGRRRLRRRPAPPARSPLSSPDSSETGAARRNKRRAADGGDARRVRLSVLMKRGVKELPLPHALKKFVNLQRCYEF